MKINNILSVLLVLLFISSSFSLNAQRPKKLNSAEIHQAIKKLNFLGSALYVAAHPDDENTSMIAYLANEVKANVAYLSLTRGDGGQNLIGPEIRELLGVIRTQELLAARGIDGGNQMFSRANDFGYSKHPDETFNIWDKEKVLADVVWGIRKWQPDVIINRFDHRSPGRTHGHHTASAMLSFEAFDMVGDKNAYPEQLKYVDAWQPRRLFFNTSWWFYGSREKFAEADKTNLMPVDVGVYYPFLGKSNTEVSALSRSSHKCQGFGSTGRRGSSTEYLELLKGDMPTKKEDIFEGINTTWTRVKGGESIGNILKRVEMEFQFDNPSASVPDLLQAYKLIRSLEDGYWRNVKLKEIEQVIQACMAMYLEAVADDYSATPSQTIELAIEAINRSEVQTTLEAIKVMPLSIDSTLNLDLEFNTANRFFTKVKLKGLELTNPYWLNQQGSLGMYRVDDQEMIGLPETPRDLKVAFYLDVAGTKMVIHKDVVYKRNDPVDGEVYRPFEVTPPVFVNIKDKVLLFANQAPKTVDVVVKSGEAKTSGTLTMELPTGWRAVPEQIDFDLELKGQEKTVTFKVFPTAQQSEGLMRPVATVNGQEYNRELVLIQYDHIPTQTVVQDCKARVVRVELEKAGNRIGYIMGAGDAIPASLEQIGYEVDILSDDDMNMKTLEGYDAIIMGIRAYNTNERLKFHQQTLLDYVENGGTMIVQYNTTRGLKVAPDKMGPYPLKLSRDRVSVEEAEIRILQPEHPVLNFPNKITSKDFEGWVQERGLYFPNEWDEKYTPILSSNDPGEPARDGGFLVAEYGKGYYIYSGYSWFRELPAGVAGAYRVFANMISIGKAKATSTRP
ncbi:MAG: PIG-L family deacetylase [Bacteroidota bacterium]